MRELFQPDSLLIRFLTRLCDLILLNLALVFLCFTVAGSGAALTAVYGMTLKMVRREDGEIVKGFLAGLKDGFTASTPATILLLLDVMLLAVIHRALYAEVLMFSPAVFVLICLVAAMLTAVLTYLFPLLGRYENPFPVQLRNAARLAISNLPKTLLMTVMNLLPFLSVTFFPADMGYLICLWALIGLAAVAYLNSFILRKMFDNFESTHESDI